MPVSIARARADLSDFWRPRTLLGLASPPFPRGLHRVTVQTHAPAYCTLRLTLHGESEPNVSFELERAAFCTYSKIFSLARPAIRVELELEPCTDPGVLASVEIEPIRLLQLASCRRLLPRLADPHLLAKVRQVISGRHSIAFSRDGEAADQQSIYQAWQVAFEGPREQQRVEAAMQKLCAGRRHNLLLVYVSSSGTQAALRSTLERLGADCTTPRTPVLAVDVAGQPLPPDVHAALSVAGGHVVRCSSHRVPLQLIIDQARHVGAGAFAYIERPGYWSGAAPDAISVELLRHPDCLAVTVDSDQISDAGLRLRPQFKPHWSPRGQAETDYVRSAVAFRATDQLVAHCGGGVDASSSRSLLHSIASGADSRRSVRHVPRILLHETHTLDVERYRIPAVQSGNAGPPPSVSVIMPTKNNPAQLGAAARSVLDCASADVELVIVDNGASSRRQRLELDRLSCDERVRIVGDPRPFNFSALINRGRQACRGDVLVLLNDDVRAVTPGWLDTLARIAAEPETGCVGALLIYPSGRIQHAGIVLGIFGVAGHAFRRVAPDPDKLGARLAAVHEVSAVTGACLAVRSELFDAVGGFDEALPVTLNDVDFCLRVHEAGYSNLMVPQVRLIHHESTTRGLDTGRAQAARLGQETAYFFAKWGDAVRSDPYYSPHLTLAREDFSTRNI
jgi:GT2 family glycosyltransferase